MSDYTIDEIEHAGLTIRIEAEQYIEEWMNPRDCDGLLGVMVTEYRGYEFGGGKHDETGVPSTDIECDRCDARGELTDRWEVRDFARALVSDDFASEEDAKKFIEWSKRHNRQRYTAEEIADWLVFPMDCPKCEGTGELELSLLDWVRHQGARVCLPLFVYEHSGITMSAGRNMLTGEDNLDRRGRYAMDPGDWDTSSVGIYFDTKETREECGCEDWSVEKIAESMDAEIEAYDAYMRGDVRLYVIEDEDGEILESCGGYLITGTEDEENLMSEAKSAAEHARDEIEAEKREAANWAARDTVTIR